MIYTDLGRAIRVCLETSTLRVSPTNIVCSVKLTNPTKFNSRTFREARNHNPAFRLTFCEGVFVFHSGPCNQNLVVRTKFLFDTGKVIWMVFFPSKILQARKSWSPAVNHIPHCSRKIHIGNRYPGKTRKILMNCLNYSSHCFQCRVWKLYRLGFRCSDFFHHLVLQSDNHSCLIICHRLIAAWCVDLILLRHTLFLAVDWSLIIYY